MRYCVRNSGSTSGTVENPFSLFHRISGFSAETFFSILAFQTHCCIPDMKRFSHAEDFDKLTAFIECQQPIPDLYTFVGNMTIIKDLGEHIVKPLNPEHVLLRGARLKNTAFIYGRFNYLPY